MNQELRNRLIKYLSSNFVGVQSPPNSKYWENKADSILSLIADRQIKWPENPYPNYGAEDLEHEMYLGWEKCQAADRQAVQDAGIQQGEWKRPENPLPEILDGGRNGDYENPEWRGCNKGVSATIKANKEVSK